MKKVMVKKYRRPIYPSPAGLITSCDKNGRPNIITLGEIFNVSVSDPVILGMAIRPATYSHSLIKESGEFVINLPTAAIAKAVDGCGRVSGRNGVNKFKRFNLTPVKAENVAPPLIAECPVNIECRLLSITTVGDHDLFLGEMTAMHVDADKWDGNKVLSDKLDMLVFTQWEYWTAGEKIGDIGFSVRK